VPAETSDQAPVCYTAGDKVFHKREQKLATVLDVYGDGVNGAQGDIRLDLSGNTVLADIEPYDATKHAAFDHTFVPIKAEWVATYNIPRSVALRGWRSQFSPARHRPGT